VARSVDCRRGERHCGAAMGVANDDSAYNEKMYKNRLPANLDPTETRAMVSLPHGGRRYERRPG